MTSNLFIAAGVILPLLNAACAGENPAYAVQYITPFRHRTVGLRGRGSVSTPCAFSSEGTPPHYSPTAKWKNEGHDGEGVRIMGWRYERDGGVEWK